jgi:hypothetical protein
MHTELFEDDAGSLLLFDAEFMAKLPPTGMMDVPFDAVIYDAKTGGTYNVRQNYAAYDENDWRTMYKPFTAYSLSYYMYAEHWCGCHRWGDIEASNPNVEIDDDHDCPSGRFYVLSMTHPNVPGVVLYAEKVPVSTPAASPARTSL